MLSATWNLLCDSALFILAGFLLAGLMQAWIDKQRVFELLGRRRKRSIFLATAIGAPLPLCSCSVLPAAMTLRRKGAGKGAVLSFLISTPETGITSIALTYALLGPVWAVLRPLVACATAITAGLIENFVSRNDPQPPAEADDAEADLGCDHDSPGGHAHDGHTHTDVPRGGPVWQRCVAGMRIAFVDIFDDVFGWILLGVVVAAGIQSLMPPAAFQAVFGNDWIAMPLMLVFGLVLYVCAEATTPVAAAFISMGLSPGAALVLLLAGPATNIGTIGVLYRTLGRRTILVYLGTISCFALASGVALNVAAARPQWAGAIVAAPSDAPPSAVEAVAAVVFLALGLGTARRQRWVSRLAALLSLFLPVRLSGRGLQIAACGAAALGYALSGWTAVQQGELGVRTRFGAVVASDLPPGLHAAWPWPVERIDRVPLGEVRRLMLGLRGGGANPHEPGTDLNESWSLVGDENIVDLKAAVHWSGRDAVAWRYGLADAESLVRVAALSAMRETLSGAAIHTVMTRERGELQLRIEHSLQARLDEYGSGIAVRSFDFVFAHAPPDAHSAFRDVASAVEDRAAVIDRALAQEARILPAARAGAAERAAASTAYASRTTALARGEADRFVGLLSAHRAYPAVTRQRLYLEALDAVLPRVRKYICPTGPEAESVEIWLLGDDAPPADLLIPPDPAENR